MQYLKYRSATHRPLAAATVVARPSAAPPGVAIGALAATLLSVTALTMVMACAPEPRAEPEFETVELGAGPTDNLRPEHDQTEALGAQGFAGQLPKGFPRDLPVPASSSVLGTAPGTVSFGTEDNPEIARNELLIELRRAGWTHSGGDGFSKGRRSVSISFAAGESRTVIRYRY